MRQGVEVLRDVSFMALNVNGLETEDVAMIRGLKPQRWVRLRSSMNRNEIHVLGLQEHHHKARGNNPDAMQRAHERIEQGTRRLRPEVVGCGEHIP